MTVAEKAEPDRADDDREARAQPRDGQSLLEQPALAVECLARRQQRGEDNRQIERFLPVDALDQGQDDPGGNHDARHPPRAVEAPAQAERQDEERQPGKAAEEVGDLNERQRGDRGQHGQAVGHGGRGAGDQEDGATNEDQRRQQVWQHECCPAPGEVDTAGDGRTAGSRLVDGKQQRRDEERQQIVDQPIGDQRAGDARGMGAIGQRQQQHRLEHAEPGRDVADHAGDAGCREDTGEGEEAQADRGQENPERQCGEGPVGHRQGDLAQCHGR